MGLSVFCPYSDNFYGHAFFIYQTFLISVHVIVLWFFLHPSCYLDERCKTQTHVQKHRSQRCVKITRQTSLSIIITFNLVSARLWCSCVCGRKFCVCVARVSFFHKSKWWSDGMAPSPHRAAAAAAVCQCSCLLFSRSPGVWPDFSVLSRFYVSRNIILFPVLHIHTHTFREQPSGWVVHHSLSHQVFNYTMSMSHCQWLGVGVWVCVCMWISGGRG